MRLDLKESRVAVSNQYDVQRCYGGFSNGKQILNYTGC